MPDDALATGLSELTDRLAQAAGQVATSILNSMDDEKKQGVSGALSAGARLQVVTTLTPFEVALNIVSPTAPLRVVVLAVFVASKAEAEP